MTPGSDPVPLLSPLGDRALLVDFGQRIDAELNARVHALAARIRAAGLAGVTDLVPAYASLAIHYNPGAWESAAGSPFAALAEALQSLLDRADECGTEPARTVEIPVRYGGEDGPDLAEVADQAGLSAAEYARRHAAGLYRVFMLGFTPGFAYLGGLDPALAAPRRAIPRTRVPAGSVGIAGAQTGIYPCASPGGWQLIGRTDATLFDPGLDEPCRFRPGDRVHFVAVGAAP